MRRITVLFAVLLTAVAVAVEPGFNSKEVVRRVGRAHSTHEPTDHRGSGLDDGEFLIDTSGIYRRGFPAAAFDGTDYLVVWVDSRSPYDDIYGARVTPEGTVLDPSGIAVSTTAGAVQRSPVLAFDGENFLVAWTDYRSSSIYPDIYAARVSPEGAVLDPDGIAISTAAHEQRSPYLAFDGENYLVVWEDWCPRPPYPPVPPSIYGARVTPAGVVLDTAGFIISMGDYYQTHPAVAFDGDNFLVVWQWEDYMQIPTIHGARVTSEGNVLDTEEIGISEWVWMQWTPAVAFDGANFLVVWAEYHGGLSFGVFGTRLTPAGVVLDTTDIHIASAEYDQLYPAVVFEGESYLVAWHDLRSGLGYDLYRARVMPDGSVFDRGPVVTQEGDQQYPALAKGPRSGMLLAYQGWAGTVERKTYNADRIWGKMVLGSGIEESRGVRASGAGHGATIVRGVLRLAAGGRETPDRVELLDISGRKVMDLRCDENDVRHLAPGVYFVREEGPRGQESEGSSVSKVVIQR